MTEKHRRVELSSTALADARAIIEYVASESPIAAQRLYARLFARVAALSGMPERGRRIPELAIHGMTDVREIIVRPYRVIYRTTESEVVVLAVLDGRRDLEDLLLERLIDEVRSSKNR